jgi:hypothetical protein
VRASLRRSIFGLFTYPNDRACCGQLVTAATRGEKPVPWRTQPYVTARAEALERGVGAIAAPHSSRRPEGFDTAGASCRAVYIGAIHRRYADDRSARLCRMAGIGLDSSVVDRDFHPAIAFGLWDGAPLHRAGAMMSSGNSFGESRQCKSRLSGLIWARTG